MARTNFNDVAIDVDGNAMAGVQVTVFDIGNNQNATIYSAMAGGGHPNPFTTGANGLIDFKADPGDYRIDLHDTQLPARFSDRSFFWESVSGADSGILLTQLDLGSFTGDVKSNATGTLTIQPGVVDTPQLAPGSVTQPKLASGSVGGPQIIDNSVTATELFITSLTDTGVDTEFLSNSNWATQASVTPVANAKYFVQGWVHAASHNAPTDGTQFDVRLVANNGVVQYVVSNINTDREIFVPLTAMVTTTTADVIAVQAQHTGGAAGTSIVGQGTRMTAVRLG